MANHIRHVVCPGCQDRRLASFANSIWKRLIRDKVGNYLYLCGRCSQELATILWVDMQADQEDFVRVRHDEPHEQPSPENVKLEGGLPL